VAHTNDAVPRDGVVNVTKIERLTDDAPGYIPLICQGSVSEFHP
jgi:hypothetical protein